MKSTLLLQAQYNKVANKAMFEKFRDLETQGKKEILYRDCGLYYRSIIKTAEHNICVSIGLFLDKLSEYAQTKPSNLDKLISNLEPNFSIRESIVNDLWQFSTLQEEVDSAIIEIINNMDDFDKVEKLVLGENLSFNKTRTHFILALLNHSTHHRGQIAGALDIAGIENDFNGMLGI